MRLFSAFLFVDEGGSVMATLNKKNIYIEKTHEGAPAARINDYQMLRRSVLSCLLWENTFYEDGIAIADRIADLVAKTKTNKEVIDLAVEAREKFKLRHTPLFLLREVAKRPNSHIAEALVRICTRPDDLTEFLAMYWKDGKIPIAAQVKKGLAKAFTRFDEYQLAKYNRDNAIKLRDVLFMVHAKPKDASQDALWKKLIDNTLAIPYTWETELSSGKNKKEAWTALLESGKLPAFALIRNLRNMTEAGVDSTLVSKALKNMKVDRILPYSFIAAERYAPAYSAQIEEAMLRCLRVHEKLPGKTLLLVDISGSMDGRLSDKSQLNRIDAASALAILIREIADECRVFTFSSETYEVSARSGFGLAAAIRQGKGYGGGTNLGDAVNKMNALAHQYDRLIVFTDEQSMDPVSAPKFKNAYMVNVASYKNGVGYGKWIHIDGFSEAFIDYIMEYEKEFK